MTGIYKIESKSHPKRCYIGSATKMGKRWSTHLAYLKRGNHHSIKLQNHYNKYGKNDLLFSVLICCDKKNLIANEQFFIDSYNPWFNICKIAGSWIGLKHTEITKQKLREINIGKHLSVEAKIKISKALKGHTKNLGKKHTEEHRRKISEAQKGQKRPPRSKETIERMRISHLGQKAWNKGIPQTEEVKRKLSESAMGNKRCLGFKHTQAMKDKIAESNRRRKIKRILQTSIN